MLALLNLRVIACLALVALLALTHFTAYRKGRANVRLEWDASISQANADARKAEQLRQSAVDAAARAAAAREAGLRADAVRAAGAVRGLRNQLAAISARSNPGDPAHHATGVLGELLQSCSEEYRSVAEEADRATSEVKTLRDAWPR